MKKVLLGLVLFLGFAGICFADASFEIISKDIDNNGNIRVWTSHKVDGVEVPSQYQKIKDTKGVEHYVWATRYNKVNFKDCADKTCIENKILDDIKNYSSVLIQKEFDKKAPKTLNQIRVDYNTSANQAFATTNLDKLVGKTASVANTTQTLDINNDGVMDTELVLKTDGSKTIKDVAVIAE